MFRLPFRFCRQNELRKLTDARVFTREFKSQLFFYDRVSHAFMTPEKRYIFFNMVKYVEIHWRILNTINCYVSFFSPLARDRANTVLFLQCYFILQSLFTARKFIVVLTFAFHFYLVITLVPPTQITVRNANALFPILSDAHYLHLFHLYETIN